MSIFSKLGGNFYNDVGFMYFSPRTQMFILDELEGLTNINDNHAHLCGVGKGDGCFINPMFYMLRHPKKYIHYKVFESACGVGGYTEDAKSKQYIERIKTLIFDIRNMDSAKHTINYRMTLLAMDDWYDIDGTKREDKTAISCSNEYIMSTCASNPEYFKPCVSIHPYRKDALETLDKYAKVGINVVKWLPNSMNIDMSSDKLIPFYDAMRNNNMKLLVHVGHEHSVDCGYINNDFGNPLLLRKPLSAGVKVVAAHCASEGTNFDFETNKRGVDNFDLFMRLMNEPAYDGKLFADVSAMIGFKRLGKPVDTVLLNDKLHKRLLFGSDYPVPCINMVVNVSMLEKYEYVTSEESSILREIYQYNPLLFNLITFKTLKKRDPDTNEIKKLPNEIFERDIHSL